jgi:hypothetical protein
MPAAAQDQRPRPFMLMNLGPAIVTAVESSAAGQGRFGVSLIGRVELPPGNALHVTPPAGQGCLADLRIRFSDGRVEDRARLDLCQPGQRVLRVPSPPP